MTADWPDDNPSAHRALAIYSQTVPLGAKAVGLGSAGTTTILANSTATLGPFTMPQIGYEISLDIGANVASLYPFTTALMTWTDSVTGRITEQQSWQMIGGSGGSPSSYYGVGPSGGDTLTITLTNRDTVNSSTYAFVLASNSRAYVRHDWRTQVFGPTPNFSKANYDPQGHVLCQTAPTVTAGNNAIRILPLYAGTVRLWATFSLAYSLIVSMLDAVVNTAPGGNQIWQRDVTNAAGGIVIDQLALPRCICTITMQNNGASSSQFGFNMVAVEQQP